MDVGELAAPSDDVWAVQVETVGESDASGTRERAIRGEILDSGQLEGAAPQFRVDGRDRFGVELDVRNTPRCLTTRPLSHRKLKCVFDALVR